MKFFIISTALLSAVALGAVTPSLDEGTSTEEFVLPDNIKTCDQDDPNLNQCIKETIQEQIPLLHKGSKVLNIPALDPFEVPDNRFEYSQGNAAGTVIIKNVIVYGFARTIIRDVKTKITDDGLESEISVFIPKIFVKGNYKADVKINEIKMRPKGFFNCTLTNVQSVAKMSGVFTTINNNKYLKLTAFDVEPEVSDMKIYASGLFPDPTLNSIILDFANQYWPEVYKLIVPQTKPHWEPIVLESANQFLLRVPFEKLLTKTN